MTPATADALKHALGLTTEEQEALVRALVANLTSSVSPAWAAELRARVAKIESGKAVFSDAYDHLGTLRDTYA